MILYITPDLPTEETWVAEAVRSVHRRGFWDETPRAAHYALIVAQSWRLVEEVGEYEDAKDWRDKMEEAADVCIVCAQMICLLRGNMGDEPYAMPPYLSNASVVQLVASIARFLRKDKMNVVLDHLYALVNVFFREYYYTDFEQVIREKLAADEERGYLHGEGRKEHG